MNNKKVSDARSLPIPISTLWDGILLISIFRTLDSGWAARLMETMLTKIVETKSKVIVMDISCLLIVDTAVASQIIKITRATKFVGCECIISGMSPHVAKSIVDLGVHLEGINTSTSIKEALEYAFKVIGVNIVSTKQ
jgi:rsbT co-antagonist protein RsbR